MVTSRLVCGDQLFEHFERADVLPVVEGQAREDRV
jgi:hypothetical protein